MSSENSTSKPSRSFRSLLQRKGYSDEAIEEIWKWYDSSKRKGVANS